MATPAQEKRVLDAVFTRGRFQGKVAIVTGGASGIGQATVERFVNDGASVAIFDFNEARGKELERTLKEAGGDVMFCAVDVSEKEKCVAAVEKVAKKHQEKIHLLVNGAACIFPFEGLSVTQKTWDKMLSVNVVGYANMVQACHPYMKNAGPGECAIVNIASISAHRGQPTRWSYAASKGAVSAMTRGMALDLSADGIRVNAVSPAWIWTPAMITATCTSDRSVVEAELGKYHMVKRLGDASEIAAAITFLCSRDASFITAIDLKLDGGSMAMSAERFGDESTLSDRSYQKDGGN